MPAPECIQVNYEMEVRAPVEAVFPLCCPVEEYKWIRRWVQWDLGSTRLPILRNQPVGAEGHSKSRRSQDRVDAPDPNGAATELLRTGRNGFLGSYRATDRQQRRTGRCRPDQVVSEHACGVAQTGLVQAALHEGTSRRLSMIGVAGWPLRLPAFTRCSHEHRVQRRRRASQG